MNQNLSLRQSA